MTDDATLPPPATGSTDTTESVEIVVPVLDEERTLRANVGILSQFMAHAVAVPWQITIADNGSTDGTGDIARDLARDHPSIEFVAVARRGRGGALRAAWSASQATVVGYMDVDLSTNLDALPALLAPVLERRADICIGTRLAPRARVTRNVRREVLSRGYNLLVRALFAPGFTDAQCGFKALRADVARELLALVRDDSWFFDTELLLLAAHRGLRIEEVAVEWIEDLDSRVAVPATVGANLRGLWRVRRALRRG